MTKRKHGCDKFEGSHAFIDCTECGLCLKHCTCIPGNFDADELGLDPETDNTPKTGSRHA